MQENIMEANRPGDSLAGPERWRKALRDGSLIVFIVLIGLSGTWLTYRAIETNNTLQRQERLNAVSQSVFEAFDLETTRAVEAVRSAALMVASQQTLTRREFESYGAGVLAHSPKLSSLQWQPLITAAELARFEATAQADGLAGYRVFETVGGKLVPASARALHVPILFSAPEKSSALGFDLASEPDRMTSRLRARDTGQPIASETYKWTGRGDEGGRALAFSVSAPVFDPDRPPSNLAERRERLKGYVSGEINVTVLLEEAAFRAAATKLDVVVFDLGAEPRKIIYALREEDGKRPAKSQVFFEPNERDTSLTVSIATRPWQIVLRPQAAFHDGDARKTGMAVLAGGTAATLLLAFAVYMTQRRQWIIEDAQASLKLSEQALQAERLRLSNILEGTGAGTMELNLQTGEIYANDRMFSMLGYTREEMHPFTLKSWRDLNHPDEVLPLTDYLTRLRHGETEVIDMESRRRHKDGHWVWVLTRGRVFSHTADGKPQWIAGTVQDISASKQAEEQIIEFNNTLEQRVQERSAELETTLATLHQSQEELARSEANATLSTLAASVSHELSTPMGNSLMTASTLVEQSRSFQRLVDANQLKRSELTAFLNTVHEGNDLMLRNLQRAVELLKNFRQVANDQASERRRSFDLATAVQEVLGTLAPSLKNSPHHVVVDIAQGIAMDSYPGPLGQIVINLINNAYLHAFEGQTGGVFTISARLAEDRVRMSFSDNGTGMSEETQSHLFQPFFSTKTDHGGTGLGLTIVANLVGKTLGGTLQVQSTVGVGTTISINLPLVAPTPQA